MSATSPNVSKTAAHDSFQGQKYPNRDWLGSDFESHIWIFGETLPGVEAAASRLNWSYAVGKHGKLTDARHRRWLTAIKAATWWHRESDLTESQRSSTSHNYAVQLRMIAAWAIDRSIRSPSEFTRDDVDGYIAHIKRLKISESAASFKLSSLRLLWVLREHLDDSLKFDPFPIRGSLDAAARLIGIANGRTHALDPRSVFRAFNEALKWLDRVEDLRIGRNLLLSTAKSNESMCPDTRGRIISSVIGAQIGKWSWLKPEEIQCEPYPSEVLRIALGKCYGALLVLLFGFVAFRKHEAAALREACIRHVDSQAQLMGKVRKTSNTPSGKATDRAVHPIVVKVVEALKSLSSDLRQSGDDSLILTDPVRSRRYYSPAQPVTTRYLYQAIDEFIDSIDIDVAKNVRPHMLRKAFALLNIWRYELGDLETLSAYLYHENGQYTLDYVDVAEADRYVPEAQQSILFDVFTRGLLKTEEFAGGFGAWLNRMRIRLQSTIQVLSIDRLLSYVNRIARRQGITIVPGPHGYCIRSNLRDRHAQCSTDGLVPDYGNRIDAHCAICPNLFAHAGSREHWLAQRKVHTIILSRPDSPAPLRAAAQVGKSACDRVLSQMDLSRAQG